MENHKLIEIVILFFNKLFNFCNFNVSILIFGSVIKYGEQIYLLIFFSFNFVNNDLIFFNQILNLIRMLDLTLMIHILLLSCLYLVNAIVIYLFVALIWIV